MTEFFVGLPSYADQVVNLISRRDWLIQNFNTNNTLEIYNPANYLHNGEINDLTYTAVLDLNIFQFLVNCSKKGRPHDNYRAAAAFLVFCQMAKIEMDPTNAVYERVNYDGANLGEALSDLQLFHNINNGNMDALAMYALGYSDTFGAEDHIQIDRKKVGENLLKYRRLTEWDSLYLIVLAIIDTHYDQAVPQSEKLVTFLTWLIREFRLSLPAVIYAVSLFGKKPIKRMMKFRTSQLNHQKRTAIFNMTWDLYLMNRFFRLWTSKDESKETLFVSDDIALRSILRLAVDVQKKECLEPIQPYLDARVWPLVQELLDSHQSHAGRVYGTDAWGLEHRADLIGKFERKLIA